MQEFRRRIEINGLPYDVIGTTNIQEPRRNGDYGLELRLPSGELAGYLDILNSTLKTMPGIIFGMIRSMIDECPEPYKGQIDIGGRLMREFERIADEEGLEVYTLATPKNREGKELSPEQTEKLFRRYGFEPRGFPLFYRKPRGD